MTQIKTDKTKSKHHAKPQRTPREPEKPGFWVKRPETKEKDFKILSAFICAHLRLNLEVDLVANFAS